MVSKWQKPLHKEEALISHLLISQPLAARISTVPCGFQEKSGEEFRPILQWNYGRLLGFIGLVPPPAQNKKTLIYKFASKYRKIKNLFCILTGNPYFVNKF
jgi:hypothetical protein